ncbi:MAG TPA: hypothetical protein VNO33_23720, partial [Kofleriaceae bacterium]|nr:hypothetical protein [Kofleriaceae bacterium]
MVDDENPLHGDGDDLLLGEDLEEWDKAFDSLHVPDVPREPVAVTRAEPVTGKPPSAGAREEDSDQFPFALPEEDLSLDGEPRALGALLGSSGRRLPLSGGEEEDGLFTSAVRPAPGTPAAPARPPRPPTSGRRPAIVRRPGTGPKRSWATWNETKPEKSKTRPGPWGDVAGEPREQGEEGESWPEERTAAMSTELVERLAESAEALFRDAPPEVSLELDEDFYEGIEVAASEARSAPADTAPPPEGRGRPTTRPPTGEGSSRRTSSHIVRRAPTPTGRMAAATGSDLSADAGRREAPTSPPPVGEVEPPTTEQHRPDLVARARAGSVEPPTTEQHRPDLVARARRDSREMATTPPPVRAGSRETATVPPPAPDIPIPRVDLGIDVDIPVGPMAEEAPAWDSTDDEWGPDPEGEPETLVRHIPGWTTPPGEQETLVSDEPGLRADLDDDQEMDAALEGAVAIERGTLMPATAADLADIDVAPDLPASRFAMSEPAIDFDALVVKDVEPSIDDRTEELAHDLLLYERELTMLDEPGPTARLRLEAGRLAEQLGDLDRARSHYDGALQLDPQLRPPLRALRRVERQLGNFIEAVRHLDAEIELASSRERRALASHRADLLMAIGEQDVARVAVGDLVDEAPTDVRALLADLELAWVDGRKDELDPILDRLAQAVADRALAGAMARTRGMLAEARGQDGGPALRGALLVDPSDRLAWMGLAHAAAARGEAGEAAELTGHLVGQGGLGLAAPALAGALEWRRGEPLIGRGELAAAGRSIARAAELLPDDPDLGEVHAVLLEAGGQAGAAADALARAADASPSSGHAARLLRRAAGLRAAAGDRAESVAILRRAAELDADEPLAAIDLTAALEAAGDEEGLVGLARRQLAADPDGAVLARVRLARGLERLGRGDEALAVLAAGRSAGLRSAALDAELERGFAAAGMLAERAQLCRGQAEEKLGYVDPAVAERRAAAALEQLARQSGAEEVAPREHDDWSERDLAPEDGVAMPEILFGPGAREQEAPEAAGLPAGIWREPTAADALAPPAPTASGALAARDAALAGWRRVLALDPGSAAARAGALRLAGAAPSEERLVLLAELERGEPEAAWATEIALRRAELLAARGREGGGDRDAAAEVLTAAAQVDADDPRSTHALLRLLAADGRWSQVAALLTDRADALGDGDDAIAHRYRAACILLDSAHELGDGETGELRRAVDLLTAVVHARPDFVIAADLLRAAQRRLGESAPAADAAAPMPLAGRRESDDGFASLLREAEMVELQVGDPGRAAGLYHRALQLSPDDPLARDGFARNAERAGEAAPLAELALADLRQAESSGDGPVVATAYEELARIDADLRGDLASAVLAWGAAVEADPTRMSAMRSLERAYLAGGPEREPELYRLYCRMLETLAGGRDTAAMLAELARLAGRAGRPQAEQLSHFRRLLELDPTSRTALFRLEAHARTEGPSRELAELEQAVARAFAGDARAEAAFYTRAGETLRAIGDREAAVASFRAAVTALPDHLPALTGWREAAASGGQWLDVADATERAAEATQLDDERAALDHLAGVVLMDRVSDGERAIAALRRVLDVDPGHTDSFLRLKLLYEETGQDVELVELYHQRLSVEEEP